MEKRPVTSFAFQIFLQWNGEDQWIDCQRNSMSDKFLGERKKETQRRWTVKSPWFRSNCTKKISALFLFSFLKLKYTEEKANADLKAWLNRSSVHYDVTFECHPTYILAVGSIPPSPGIFWELMWCKRKQVILGGRKPMWASVIHGRGWAYVQNSQWYSEDIPGHWRE